MRKAASVVSGSAAPRGPRLRPVVVDALLVAGARAGHGRAQQALGLLDAVPAQVVDHLAARGGASSARSVWRRKSSTTHHSGAAGPGPPSTASTRCRRAARDEVAEPLRDRVEELALLGEERALVGRAGIASV